eukprot:m.85426 g.85426  ORF g.85426 m.85426 type:complete len:787 (+) comp8741_c0_seq2:114-2474(+)
MMNADNGDNCFVDNGDNDDDTVHNEDVCGEDEGVVEAITRARRSVAQTLQRPDDFAKVEQLRLRALRKRVAIEKRLKTVVQSQITDVYEAFHLLERSLQDLKTVQTRVDESESLIKNCDQLQHHVGQAKVVSNSRNKLQSTMKQLEHICSLPEDVEEIETMLAEEQTDLLEIHSKLMAVERRVCEIQSKIADSMKRSFDTDIKTYFEKLKTVSKKFEDMVMFVGKKPLKLVEEDPTTLVSVLRIIYREEKLDEGRNFSWAKKKELLKTYFDMLETDIENTFDCMLGGNTQVVAFLQNFDDFYFQDLRTAKEKLPKCFPPSIDIFDFYLNHYHAQLCKMTEYMRNSSSMEPSGIMSLLNWVHDYRSTMKKQLSVNVSELTIQLLGVDEDNLKDEYIEMLQDKIRQWISKIVAGDVKIWLDNKGHNADDNYEEKMPTLSGDDLYVTDTPVILFTMIEQQLGVAFQRGGGGPFAAKIIKLCLEGMKQFQLEIKDGFAAVSQKYCQPNVFQPPSLVAHIIAGMNNCFRSVTTTEELKDRIAAHYDTNAPMVASVTEIVDELVQGFHDVTIDGLRLLLGLIETMIVPLFDNLFVMKWMRSRVPLQRILATLKDYFNDVIHLHTDNMQILFGAMFRKVAILYLQALMSKRFQPRDDTDRDTLLDNLSLEEKRIKECFQEFSVFEDHMGENPYLAFEFVHRLLEEPKTTLQMTYYRARNDYPGFNFNHLECIFYLRHDIKSPRQFIKDTFIKKKKQKRDPRPPTRKEIEDADFFVKINTENKEFPIFPEEEES